MNTKKDTKFCEEKTKNKINQGIPGLDIWPGFCYKNSVTEQKVSKNFIKSFLKTS